MKLTKEKYNLLDFWTRWYAMHATPNTIGLICFSCGITGAIVMELPDNHEIFSMELIEGAKVLTDILNNYSREIKKTLKPDQ